MKRYFRRTTAEESLKGLCLNEKEIRDREKWEIAVTFEIGKNKTWFCGP